MFKIEQSIEKGNRLVVAKGCGKQGPLTGPGIPWEDENVLELHSEDDCTKSSIYQKQLNCAFLKGKYTACEYISTFLSLKKTYNININIIISSFCVFMRSLRFKV